MSPGIAVALLAASAIGAWGCRRPPAPSAPVTFNKDIAPIVFANCASCHRSGGAAPFPLLTYADAVQRAGEIAKQTRERHMAPWLPERGEYPFLGERRLTDAQIEAIQRWVKDGAREGNAPDLPKAPEWTEGWQLGQPDAVLTIDRPFQMKPNTEDVYRNLVLRTSFESGVFVRGVEFKTNGAPETWARCCFRAAASEKRCPTSSGRPS